MLANYFKTATRSLLRNKIYTAINVTGLSVGIAVCLVIFIIIRFETGYDGFHHKKDRLYRVTTAMPNPDGSEALFSSISFPLPQVLQQEIPSIEGMSPFVQLPGMHVLLPEKNSLIRNVFKEKSGIFAVSPAFFQLFDFSFLAGNPAVLNDHHSIILTKATAERYFGNWKKSLGQTIQLGLNSRFQVGGVVERPVNTEFQFEILLPFAATPFSTANDWKPLSDNYHGYVLLSPNASVTTVNRQLAALAKKYLPATVKNTFRLEPLADVHFNSSTFNFGSHGITRGRIKAMWCIAVFILLIACVNFINLSTAQVVKRTKEVGIRKVLGSNQGQLKTQFFVETFALVLTSCLLAILLAAASLSPLGHMLNIPLPSNVLFQPATVICLALVLVTVTLLAGLYPAIVIARINPLNTLKSKLLSNRPTVFSLRKSLVVFQFMIAQALIIGTLIIIKQMSFFKTTPLGFDKELVVNIPLPGDSVGVSRFNMLHNRLANIKQVAGVSFNAAPPATDDNWWTGFKFDHASEENKFAVLHKSIDTAYLNIFHIPLVTGRDMTGTDSIREFLVNETFVKKMGFHDPADILNKSIELWGMTGTIVGVVKDFYPTSLKEEVPPVLLLNVQKGFGNAAVKLSGTDLREAIGNIEKIWYDTYPGYPFEYKFLDDQITAFYTYETQLSLLYQVFAAVAIFLSCLGLYGLASYMAVQRVKEVGVRKVLGATVGNIVLLFSREFVVLVGIAFLLAAPLAWYFLHQWLQSYAHSTTMSWWVFITGGLAALAIALMTVSFHAIRAARANPVKSLRGE